MNQIRGKIAQVLNSREVVLNIGEKNGVKKGMLFDILDSKGENILDPDSGEILGSIERPKVRVKVISVQDNLAVLSTYKKTEVNIGGTGGFGISASFAASLIPPKYVTKHETLNTDEKTWEDLDEEDSYVKIGDPVKEVKDYIDE